MKTSGEPTGARIVRVGGVLNCGRFLADWAIERRGSRRAGRYRDRENRPIVLVSLLVVIGAACAGDSVKEVTIFNKGAAHEIHDEKRLSRIGRQAIVSVQGADDVLREIVEPRKMTEMMSQEDGVEVVFSNVQKIYPTNNRHPITFSRLYVPLSGKYATFGLVLFFGDSETYGHLPPYVNTSGKEDFMNALREGP